MDVVGLSVTTSWRTTDRRQPACQGFCASPLIRPILAEACERCSRSSRLAQAHPCAAPIPGTLVHAHHCGATTSHTTACQIQLKPRPMLCTLFHQRPAASPCSVSSRKTREHSRRVRRPFVPRRPAKDHASKRRVHPATVPRSGRTTFSHFSAAGPGRVFRRGFASIRQRCRSRR